VSVSKDASVIVAYKDLSKRNAYENALKRNAYKELSVKNEVKHSQQGLHFVMCMKDMVLTMCL
jgi:hypothetical protein